MRNPFFTGRESIIEDVRTALMQTGATALTQPQAISGLGGIGKTQIAVEYAYRFRSEHHSVLWANAQDEGSLVAGLAGVAKLVGAYPVDGPDLDGAAKAAKHWLSANPGWLLVLDNVDDLRALERHVPLGATGQILITTRAQSTGHIANDVQVTSLDLDAGALLLLRRCKLLSAAGRIEDAQQDDLAAARDISKELGGLPLALDQAAAFIDEMPCSSKEYLDLYRNQGHRLRKERGEITFDHPSVTVTFSVAYDHVKAKWPEAATLIRHCAYLAPVGIPENLLQRLLPTNMDQIEIATVIRDACRFSLVQRNTRERTIQIHRLVQEVLKDIATTEENKNHLGHSIHAVELGFPEHEFTQWKECAILLPHALGCIENARIFGLENQDLVTLLSHTGTYLGDCRRLVESEELCRKAVNLAISLGAGPEVLARCQNDLGRTLQYMGRWQEALMLHKEALSVRKACLGPRHRDVAISMNNLGATYKDAKKLAAAIKVYKNSIQILRKCKDDCTYLLGRAYGNLAVVCLRNKNLEDGKKWALASLAISREVLEIGHPDIASCMNLLAAISFSERNYLKAEEYSKEAMVSLERGNQFDIPLMLDVLLTYEQILIQIGKTAEMAIVHERIRTLKLKGIVGGTPLKAERFTSVSRRILPA